MRGKHDAHDDTAEYASAIFERRQSRVEKSDHQLRFRAATTPPRAYSATFTHSIGRPLRLGRHMTRRRR